MFASRCFLSVLAIGFALLALACEDTAAVFPELFPIYIAGERFIYFIYEVFVMQKKKENALLITTPSDLW
jgi:hypothetical protein